MNSEVQKFYCMLLSTGASMHAADQLSRPTVTVSAESVDGSTPAARVTWNTTVPPECVASVTVQFRTSRYGPVVATYTTTNTSQTEIIQTGLQCATNYYIRVVVTGATSDGSTVSSSSVQVFIGGKEIVYNHGIDNYTLDSGIAIVQIYPHHLK